MTPMSLTESQNKWKGLGLNSPYVNVIINIVALSRSRFIFKIHFKNLRILVIRILSFHTSNISNKHSFKQLLLLLAPVFHRDLFTFVHLAKNATSASVGMNACLSWRGTNWFMTNGASCRHRCITCAVSLAGLHTVLSQ